MLHNIKRAQIRQSSNVNSALIFICNLTRSWRTSTSLPSSSMMQAILQQEAGKRIQKSYTTIPKIPSPESENLLFYFPKEWNVPKISFPILVCFSLNNFMWCLNLDAPCKLSKNGSSFKCEKISSLTTFKEFFSLLGIVWRWETLFLQLFFLLSRIIRMKLEEEQWVQGAAKEKGASALLLIYKMG